MTTTLSTDADTVRHAIATVLRQPLDGLADEALNREQLAAWDSLKHFEILLAVEEAFAVQFSEAEFAELSSLAAIVAALRERHAA